ncbi:unnamed protein product, partial [Ectocarpus sp. 12 AP-2014]
MDAFMSGCGCSTRESCESLPAGDDRSGCCDTRGTSVAPGAEGKPGGGEPAARAMPAADAAGPVTASPAKSPPPIAAEEKIPLLNTLSPPPPPPPPPPLPKCSSNKDLAGCAGCVSCRGEDDA